MMEKPKETVCKQCGEKIYGLTEKDLKQKIVMHNLKHRDKEGK